MTVREYIGARYVPLYMGLWDNSVSYEPLSVVVYEGDSYTSRQAVPVGIDITNETYWIQSANYSAQIEAYRQEVQTFNNRINQNATDIDTLESIIPSSSFSSSNTVKNYVDKQIALTNKKYIGIVGDSYSKTAENSFNGYWTNRLHYIYGYTIINESVNGVGFVEGTATTNFQAQLNNIIANEHFSEMDYVIIYGGLNDFTHLNAPNPTSTMRPAFIAMRDAFVGATVNLPKKPKLIFAFGNIGRYHRSIYNGYMTWYSECMKILRDIGMPGLVDYVPYWHGFLPNSAENYFNEDLTHPNQLGQWVISSFMESIISGTYTGVHRHYEFDSSYFAAANFTNLTNGKITLDFDNGIVSFNIAVSCDSFNTSSGAITELTTNLGGLTAFIGDYKSATLKQAFISGTRELYNSSGKHSPIYYNTNNGIIYATHIFPDGKSANLTISDISGIGTVMSA